jgi:hypothetical protein
MGLTERKWTCCLTAPHLMERLFHPVILVVRTYAIYDSSRRILISLSALWVAWIAANVPIIYFYTQSIKRGLFWIFKSSHHLLTHINRWTRPPS